MELLASKFDSKATKVESWAVGKDDTLMQTDDIEGSNLAEIMVSREGEGGREGGERQREGRRGREVRVGNCIRPERTAE